MTDKYLKITNKVDFVSRVSLEKLGLSTKRNDPNTIGQFGSGIKFAPIAALREGLEWWFTGTDSKGQYKMNYSTEIEDGIECVVYDYGDYRKASSFTVDAGCLSWVNNFQIYREAVANAIDEAGEKNDWSISIVSADEIVSTPGEFSVYITASPGMMEIHNNFEKYFSVNRTPIFSVNTNGGSTKNVHLLEKIDDTFRIYSHNVLVYSDDTMNSCYDYNIDSLELNEERTIRSSWDLEWVITNTMTKIIDQEIITNFIVKGMKNPKLFEFQKMSLGYLDYSTIAGNWCDWFIQNHGDNVVLHDQDSELHNISMNIKLKGYTPVLITSPSFYKFLVEAGNRNYMDILGKEYDIKADSDYTKYRNVDIAMNIAMSYIPELKDVIDTGRFGIYSSDTRDNLGLTINMKESVSERKMYVNIGHVNDSVEHILATIIHEYDHLSTGLGDNDYYMFRDVADKRIASLMVKNYKNRFFEILDGKIILPIKNLGNEIQDMNFTLSKVIGVDMIVLNIGGNLLKINGDALYNGGDIDGLIHGFLSPYFDLKAKTLTVDGLTNVKEVERIG